ncbi:MAG: hypothetical protein B6242_03490, partial [Anaerolineaceae bacterium 4572_78]
MKQTIYLRLITLLIFLLVVLFGLPILVSADNSWNDAAPLPNGDERSRHTTTLLPDGRILVVGGYNGAALDDAKLYDPITNEWSDANDVMFTERYSHTATLLRNGNILIAGGHDGSSALDTAFVYDPVDNIWNTANGMSTARYNHTATMLANGDVLVVGGGVSISEIYNPSTNTWGNDTDTGTVRSNHTATLLDDGKVLVVGGDGSGTAQLYDNGTWNATTAFDSNIQNHTATLLPDGNVLVAGGYNGTIPSNVAKVYNGVSWTATSNTLTDARYNHTATLLPNGKVLVTGGCDNGNVSSCSSYLNSAELYDWDTNSWSVVTDDTMTDSREKHTATMLPNGKIFVVGGKNGGGDVGGSELFDSITDGWINTDNFANSIYWHATTVLTDGKVLVSGGCQSGNTNS